MKYLWKWKVELVVFVSYLALGALYFYKKSVDPERRHTFLDPLSNEFQLHLAKGKHDQIVLYDLAGNRESVRFSEIRGKKQKFLDFIASEISQHGDMELKASVSDHYLQCNFVSSKKVLIFPLSESFTLDHSRPALFENLCNLTGEYEREPVNIKSGTFDDLVRLLSVYFGNDLKLDFTLTNDHVFLRVGPRLLVFALNVKDYLARYDIGGFADGERILKIAMVDFRTYVCVPTSLNRYEVFKLFIPLKHRAAVPKHSEYYYQKKFRHLKNLEYEPYTSSKLTARFREVLENALHSQKFNLLLARVYHSLQGHGEKEAR